MSQHQWIAQLESIRKCFGSTQALVNVDFAVAPGTVHAIVGENGAGKSTLGKILAGVYTPDSGRIVVDGTEVSHWSVKHAQQLGIAMIAQELSLVPELTVAENIFLGLEHTRAGFLVSDLLRRFEELEKMVGFGLDPTAAVKGLPIAERQKVEIMRALARNARVLVLDEPTSSLTGHETAHLHTTMRQLTSQGTAIIYVSHFLDAVLDVSDVVTVLRNGEQVLTAPRGEISKETMINRMLGHAFQAAYPKRSGADQRQLDDSAKLSGAALPSTPLLQVCGVSGPGVRQMDLTVRRGEIVGLLGLVGSGRTEMARIVFGAERADRGEILLDGKPIRHHGIRTAIRHGISMVPEDRHGQGLFLLRSICENISLLRIDKFVKFGLISKRRESMKVQRIVDQVRVKPADIRLDVGGLSGGNQQKVLIAKWILDHPELIIFDEPTRGVDIGSKFAIYELINAVANQGAGVLLISSEHEEILNLADRAYLVSEGCTVAEVDPGELTVEMVLQRLFAAQTQCEETAKVA